jgi:cell division septation protein DedD
MRDYEEKSYYEIQLDNKQLILVFLACVTVCVLIFVLGVMVGKGKKEAEMASVGRSEIIQTRPEPDLAPPQEIQAVPADKAPKGKKGKKDQEEAKAGAQDSDEYAYYDLDKTSSEKPLTKEPEKVQKAKPEPEPVKPAALTKVEEPEEKVEPAPVPVSESGRYTVQVMATSSKTKAEQRMDFLKSKGYTAFMNEERAGDSSVFKVRVGKFNDTDAAKKVAARLKQELQLETWVAVLD